MDRWYAPRDAARLLGVTVKTIQRWDQTGLIRCERTPTGKRRIPETEIQRLQNMARPARRRLALYARVSSHEQKAKGDLGRQLERLKCEATARGEVVAEIAEVGSGLNDGRQGLHRILGMIADGICDGILVEHADRLSRFGFRYLEAFAKTHGAEIQVVERSRPGELEKELVDDMISIVSSFAGKLYGMRSEKRRQIKATIKSVLMDDTLIKQD
ncbi:MAG: IS607 family transposase [Candidatus Schekmanbacteria bacterium]|nr:IS607 family transposase [Candidatus Schekmanbacteria bacterium]